MNYVIIFLKEVDRSQQPLCLNFADCGFALPANIAKGKEANQSWPDDGSSAGLVVDGNWETDFTKHDACSYITNYVCITQDLSMYVQCTYVCM